MRLFTRGRSRRQQELAGAPASATCLHLDAVRVDSVLNRDQVYHCLCPDCGTELPANFRRPCCGTEPESPHLHDCPEGPYGRLVRSVLEALAEVGTQEKAQAYTAGAAQALREYAARTPGFSAGEFIRENFVIVTSRLMEWMEGETREAREYAAELNRLTGIIEAQLGRASELADQQAKSLMAAQKPKLAVIIRRSEASVIQADAYRGLALQFGVKLFPDFFEALAQAHESRQNAMRVLDEVLASPPLSPAGSWTWRWWCTCGKERSGGAATEAAARAAIDTVVRSHQRPGHRWQYEWKPGAGSPPASSPSSATGEVPSSPSPAIGEVPSSLSSAMGEVRKRVPLSPEIRKAVWVRDGGCCRRCGISDDRAFQRDGEHLHFDHIIPFSRNGADSVGNIQLLCGPCNRSKNNRFTG